MLCPIYKEVEDVERYRVTQLARANQDLTQEVASHQALEQRHLVEVEKLGATLKLLSESEATIVKNSEIHFQTAPVLSSLIVQDKAFYKLNLELELEIQKNASLNLTQVLDELSNVYSRQLSPASKKIVESMLVWMKDAEGRALEWQREQQELIKKLRLREVSALEGLLFSIAQVVSLNSENVQNIRRARDRMEGQKTELRAEITRLKEQIAKNQETIKRNQPRIDQFRNFVAELRKSQEFCGRWNESRPYKKEAF